MLLGNSPLAAGPLAAQAGPLEPSTLIGEAQITVTGTAVTAPDIDAYFNVSAASVPATVVQFETMSATASVSISGATPPILAGPKQMAPAAAPASVTAVAVLLPDPTNYGTKDVLTGSISAAQRTASIISSAATQSVVPYANAIATTSIAGGNPDALVITVASPDAASVAVAVTAYITNFQEANGSASIQAAVPAVPTFHVRSWIPTTASIITTAFISAQMVRIRVANLSGNNGTISLTSPATTSILRQRGFTLDAAPIEATSSSPLPSMFKGMAVTANIAVTGVHTARVVQSVNASADLAITAVPSVSSRLRMVTADVTGAATASATGVVIQFVPMSAAAGLSITASASAARAALMNATASAVLTGTANPRAIFSGAFQAAITAGYFAILFRHKLNPRTDAVVERYSRRVLPTGELRDVLGNEFQNIERTVASVTEATILLADNEPETKRKGMVRYAVAPWIPVAGHSGLVVYDGNSWSAV